MAQSGFDEHAVGRVSQTNASHMFVGVAGALDRHDGPAVVQLPHIVVRELH
jgi:hypothetical protein